MEHHRAKMILEAALLSASEPLLIREIIQMFDGTVDEPFVLSCLEALRSDWSNRGLELVQLGVGWRFQTRSQVRHYIESIHPEKSPKYSRAVLETLAIIAYKQPVTRGDIESIRGVTVSSLVVKSLEDRGWIEVIGHREVLGRPALWATTSQFLADLGLKDLSSLPSLEGDNATDAFQNVIPLNVDHITRNNENTTT